MQQFQALSSEGSNPFLGIIGLKDCFLQKEQTSTFSANTALLYFTSKEDSKVAELLKEVELKVKTTEQTQFCCGTLDFTKIHKNGLYVGASSSGALKDLEDELIIAGVTTDTGGSTVVPAARATYYALKPTYGRISRRGLVPLCSFLDTVAITSKEKKYLRPLFKILDQYDVRDQTSIKPQKRAFNEKLELVIAENFFSAKDLEILKKEYPNAETKTLDLPSQEVLEGLYYYCVCPELYSNLRKFNGFSNKEQDSVLIYNSLDLERIRSEGLNEEVKSRVFLGEQILKNYDVKKIYKMKKYLNSLLDQKTWLLPVGENLYSNRLDEHRTSLSGALNLTGRPILTVKSTLKNGLQIVSPKNSDYTLLDLFCAT